MSETLRVMMPMNPHQPDGNMVSLTALEAAQAWRREFDAEFARRATADRLLMELAASGPADVRSRITDYFAAKRPEAEHRSPLHAAGCGCRLTPDSRGGWSCEKCGWPADQLEHPADPDPGDVHTG